MTRATRACATGALAVLVAAGFGAAPAVADANDRRLVATSSEGRPIVARHYGAIDAPVQLLVVGQMHGNESGGRAVIADLAAAEIPDGVGLWLIASMNPDGHRVGSRTNGRGVDLNRNFPAHWRRAGHGTGQWSGARPASEPETRGMIGFLTEVRPTALISFHQAFDLVDITLPRSAAAGTVLAEGMGERAALVPCLSAAGGGGGSGACHGTMTDWVDQTLQGIAITVELDDRVSGSEARRAAGAVLRLGEWLGR